jgi:RimJ/RimL family protein N-acetyltransferase
MIRQTVFNSRPTLTGALVRLEPLEERHIGGLVRAAEGDREIYQWSFAPCGVSEVTAYVRAAIAAREAGTAVPFATVRTEDDTVIGSTRFFDIERWAWPGDSERKSAPLDGCEIGYTWLARSAMRTGANTEAKLLMLTHAFERWHALRICLHTDARNTRSRAAMERIGARFEGILRSHRLAVDYIARDSARYSIVAEEWPTVKRHIEGLLLAHAPVSAAPSD